ncbi:peptidase inhibitor family I36 protein [Streptomyces phaeochromogenes]|uniref:peptidase inhibitor family I36 protein n=1 Tax=Streptomyces phaeochromogenes TaxID=1923 RepID=UPI0033FA97C5
MQEGFELEVCLVKNSIRGALVLVCTASALASGGIFASPALAATNEFGPNGFITLYTDRDFTGGALSVSGPLHDLSAPVGDISGDDMASSVENRTTKTYCLYKDANFLGSVRKIGAGKSVALLNGGWNDSISSFKPC